jgi:transcription elongation factor Elf1
MIAIPRRPLTIHPSLACSRCGSEELTVTSEKNEGQTITPKSSYRIVCGDCGFMEDVPDDKAAAASDPLHERHPTTTTTFPKTQKNPTTET